MYVYVHIALTVLVGAVFLADTLEKVIAPATLEFLKKHRNTVLGLFYMYTALDLYVTRRPQLFAK